jgi:tetratricopeptide (TPR) repeat protein
MNSAFHIRDIKKIDNHYWEVKLTLVGDSDLQLYTLTERIREETQGPTGWHRLGKFLLKLGQFDKATQVNEALLDRTTIDRDKSVLYNQLGSAKNSKGEYKEAITFYERSLIIRQKTLQKLILWSLSPTTTLVLCSIT